MRFAGAHKVTSYLMAVCAYFALVLSGELSELVVLLSLAAIPASWFWEPPRIRFERFSRTWTGVSVLVFVYSVLSALAGGDVLLIGASFLIYLAINKLFNRRACKDYLQLYILSFLMLVAATVLNGSFTFGVFFLGFVISSTWAIILFHLRREMEDNFLLKHSEDKSSERVQVQRILNSKRIVGKSFFFGTSMVSLSIFVFATMLFLMIPRIGFGLFFQKSRTPVNMTGFSDGVQLGGHGLIKNDDTVVMRVHIDDEYHGRNAPYIHWRGVAFDLYDKGQWRRSREAPKTERRVVIPRRGVTRHHLLYNQRNIEPEVLNSRMRKSVRQEVYLEPTGYDVLFGASMPMTYEFESSQNKPRKARNDEIRYRHAAGIKYVVYSDLEPPRAAEMRKALDVVPVGFDVYLDVPSDVPNRVIELAQEITRDEETQYDKVKAIERWLKSNLDYTLRMQDPEGKEPIDFFLFDRKAGHCEYFSSAMAIMVRAVGSPSRNVNGFLGGEWNEYNDYIAVRAGDAHSWVEVYFHEVGWVTFDPTPAAEVDQLGRGGLSLVDKLRRMADTIRFKWFKWVIEYDFFRQMSLFRKVSRGLKRGAGGFLEGGPSRIKEWFRRNKTTGVIAIVVAIGFIAIVSIWRRRRRTADEQLGQRAAGRRRRSAVSSIYASVLGRLAKRGYRRSPSTTPREHARALAELEVPGSRELMKLTDLYYSVEFGGRADGPAVEEARRLRGAIDSALKIAKERGQASA